jgi:hypothetical protein
MSDTEEVVLTRAKREKVNTKPEIAREKLKEKRERLKKEKENLIIEEAKKRLVEDSKKAEQEALLAKQKEEEQKQADPTYALLMKMEQMMAMMKPVEHPKVVPSTDKASLNEKKKRAPRKKVEIPEPEPEPEKPKRKPREPKPIINKSPGLPKPRKKVVYLQQEPVPEESTQFVGYDIAPPSEPIQYQPSSGLLSALMGRRNMNTIYN